MAIALKTGSSECPVCGGIDQEPMFKVPFPHGHPTLRQGFALSEELNVPFWVIARCRNCGLQFASPRPTSEDISDFYSNQLEPNDWEQQFYLSSEHGDVFLPLVKAITAMRGGPGLMLEIGCAGGWLLCAAKSEGWEVLGIEPSPKFHSYATQVAKLPVILGTLDNLPDEKFGTFDTIVLLDVLEHLQDPMAELCKIQRVLAPGGHLIVSAPNIDSICARFYGTSWRQIVISHTVYWTHKSMKLALDKAGLELVQVADARYWHPDKNLQSANRVREIAKFIARAALLCTYVPISKSAPIVQKFPAAVSKGRLNHSQLLYKIGDQPVLDDVMLVVAKRPS